MLISFIPYSLLGGSLCISMPIYSYISSTNEPKLKTIRFAILESIIFIGKKFKTHKLLLKTTFL
jgi:hypothetical protein